MKKFLLLFLLAWTPLTQASEIEISGIVIDRTITRFGKDFFFYYTSYWRDIPSTEGITVVVYEQVFPQAGTRLWVEMERETIFQTYFGRRQNDVRKTAEQAVLISLNKVAEFQAEAMLDKSLGDNQ
jgi:curli production assembly/transport component CsgE